MKSTLLFALFASSLLAASGKRVNLDNDDADLTLGEVDLSTLTNEKLQAA